MQLLKNGYIVPKAYGPIKGIKGEPSKEYCEGKFPKYFPQTEGVAMGGVVSPMIANLVLRNLERDLRKDFGQHIKVYIYADD